MAGTGGSLHIVFLDGPGRWVPSGKAARHLGSGTRRAGPVRLQLFNLAKHYEEQAADELISIELSLEEAYDAGGASDVKELLQAMARSCGRPRTNTWMAALHEGLALKDWYCGGGFRFVAAG